MTDIKELASCPFCGSRPIVFDSGAIKCMSRDCWGPIVENYDNPYDAIAAWNRRPEPSSPVPSASMGRVREALLAARDLAKTMEGLTSCRSDDDYVWGAQAKIEAAIAALDSPPDHGGGDTDAGRAALTRSQP